MNSLLKRALHNPVQKRAVRSPERSLQGYLDSLCEPLTGVLPADQCREVRLETEGHLLALIAELCADDLSAEAATEAAVRAYGAPHSLGCAIRKTWNAGAGVQALRSRNVARLLAFLCVSLMMFDSGALLELYAVDPSGSGTPLGFLLIRLAALAVLTGGATALLIPFRSAPAIAKMASVWLLYAFAGGFAMPPQQDSIGVALFLLCVPLPISALVAHFISTRFGRRDYAPMSPLSTR